MAKYAFDTNVFIETFRDASAKAAMRAFLESAFPYTFLSAVVMQELATGARTAEQSRHLHETVITPFTRCDRVFAPSREAFFRSGQLLASVAKREGWSDACEKPSLLNDALIAASCRERGITLITYDKDYGRFRPFLNQWTAVAPWPSISTERNRQDESAS
jgi:predicted nucleic acid-binding protein